MNVVFSDTHPGRTDSYFTSSCSGLFQNSFSSCPQVVGESSPRIWSHYFIIILFLTKNTIFRLLNYLILKRFLMISKKWNPPKSNLHGKNDGVVQLRGGDSAERRNQYGGWPQHPGTSAGHQEDCLDHVSCRVCEKPCTPSHLVPLVPATYSQHEPSTATDHNPAPASFAWKSPF